MKKEEAYQELERLKRMDEYLMYNMIDELYFVYSELGARIEARQCIIVEENGEEIARYHIEKPMNRDEFEKFCKQIVYTKHKVDSEL